MPSKKYNKVLFEQLINGYYYFYTDAKYFHTLAKDKSLTTEINTLCRTAVLLYIFSLEALINRALHHFLPNDKKYEMNEIEKKSIEEKYNLLPKSSSNKTFDKTDYPWNNFTELITLRNDFVHPKYTRKGYFESEKPKGEWSSPIELVAVKHYKLPPEVNIKHKDLEYPQTQIPKPPNSISIKHADKVKEIVDAMVSELDSLLDGKITDKGWLNEHEINIIYPPQYKQNITGEIVDKE